MTLSRSREFDPYLPLQEPEYSCWTIVPLERERAGVHRQHAVQVTEDHVGQQSVAYEAQLV